MINMPTSSPEQLSMSGHHSGFKKLAKGEERCWLDSEDNKLHQLTRGRDRERDFRKRTGFHDETEDIEAVL